MPTYSFAHRGPVMGTGEFIMGFFEITSSSGTPTITSDPDNLTSAIADTATGSATVTLTHRYYKINAFCNHEAAGGLGVANASTVTDGLSAANTLLVNVSDVNTGALADIDGVTTVMVLGRLVAGS